MSSTLSRRSFLSTVLHGTAVLALPALGSLPTEAFAAGAPRRARRVLVINLSGGVRSSAAFLASGSKALNPWGRLEKGPFPLGRLLDDHLAGEPPPTREAYTFNSGAFANTRLLPFRELASKLAVVGTWDAGRGDHERSQRVMASGTTSADAPGLVVKLFAALSAGAAQETPAFVVGDAKAFAVARDKFSRFAAVDIADPNRLPAGANRPKENAIAEAVGHDFVPPGAADALDAHSGAGGRELALTYALHHRTGLRLRGLLTSPALSVMRDSGEGAALGTVRTARGQTSPLTNEMLREVVLMPQRFGAAGGREGSGADPSASTALAVRLLQIGSPAVAIDIPGFDAHSGERTAAPPLYRQLGVLLSGLHFLLSRIVDPQEPGVSMLDRTLVVTTSEFGRDPGIARTGFNGGEGSDHGSHPACFYVAHALMGAGVTAGKLVGGVSTDTYDARREAVRYSPQRLLATIGHALGIDMAQPQWGFEGAAPIEEVWTA